MVLAAKSAFRLLYVLALSGFLSAAGCGASKPTSGSSSSGTASSAGGAAALSAEARSAATGDIPDNQVFLLYTNAAARYSIKYPEGWTRSGMAGDVILKQKNNVVHIVVEPGAAPTTASVAARLHSLKAASPSLSFTAPQTLTIGGAPVVRATYTTKSQPDPVTGRSVVLIVDRYVLAHGGMTATVDLGTQQGVDNVDAYRKMIESFHWS